MSGERDAFADKMNLEMSATDAGLAANSDDALMQAELDMAAAESQARTAETDLDRLRAELALEGAAKRAIQAMAADSRADWEIGVITDASGS